LLFLSWYCCSEPIESTGLPDDARDDQIFESAFRYLGEIGPANPEFLFVAGYMASFVPFCCGDTQRWTETGRECLIRFSNGGETLNWVDFEGRGAYGQYFATLGGVIGSTRSCPGSQLAKRPSSGNDPALLLAPAPTR